MKATKTKRSLITSKMSMFKNRQHYYLQLSVNEHTIITVDWISIFIFTKSISKFIAADTMLLILEKVNIYKVTNDFSVFRQRQKDHKSLHCLCKLLYSFIFVILMLYLITFNMKSLHCLCKLLY